jgi:protein Tob/BTG
MSPTEFSNYIKQRAIQQQIHHHHHHHHQAAPPSPTGRSLSPNTAAAAAAAAAAGQQPPDPTGYFFQPAGPYHPQFPHRNLFEAAAAAAYMPELYPAAKFPGAASSYLDPASVGHQFYNSAATNASNAGSVQVTNSTTSSTSPQDNGKQLLEGLNNFGLGSVAHYPPSPYQHLLVAN